MALKSLICPQCGAQIELDDADRDYGFCTSCGTKIQLNEIVKVQHTGTVSLDNSSQARNRISIADKAFDSRNFGEAYEYYTRALEDAPEDYKSLYRKGICAIYLSTPDNFRSEELITLMNAAKVPSDVTDTERKDMILTKDQDIELMLRSLFGYFHSNSSTQASVDSCVSVFRRLFAIAAFASRAIGFIENESVKEAVLAEAVDYCDKVSNKKLNYISGVKTDKKGKRTEVTSTYVIDADSKKKLADLRNNFADQYNNLPSRVARGANLSSSINSLEGDIKNAKDAVKLKKTDLKLAKKAFWDNNVQLKMARKKALLPSVIAFGVLAIAAIVFFIIGKSNIGWILVVAAIILPIAMAKIAWSLFESKYLPDSIKAQAGELKNARKDLMGKQKSLKSEQKDLKTFKKSEK